MKHTFILFSFLAMLSSSYTICADYIERYLPATKLLVDSSEDGRLACCIGLSCIATGNTIIGNVCINKAAEQYSKDDITLTPCNETEYATVALIGVTTTLTKTCCPLPLPRNIVDMVTSTYILPTCTSYCE